MYSDTKTRFADSTSGNTYNSVSDFPQTGSGFGTTITGILLYDGFNIPAYSRICFMNYGNSKDAALLAVDPAGILYSAFRKANNWTNGRIMATKADLDSKLELVSTEYLPLTAATIQPNNYVNFNFTPSLPSGYILVGACIKDTSGLAGKVAPLYSSASTSSDGTHKINFRLANTSDATVSITTNMGIAFYLFVRKK